MKILIAFYSRSGHTEQIAREMSALCGAHIDRIQDFGLSRKGLLGYLRCSWEAIRGSVPAIEPAIHDPRCYELVVIGTPVWNWSLASPVRTYVQSHAGEFRRVAFFCTKGGSGDHRVFRQLEILCHQAPLEKLAVNAHDLATGAHMAPLQRFVDRIRSAPLQKG
ncbi:MAG: hypothetical protein RI949_2653 [Pseudomonadota bacterium]|jgi:flavodoxin